MKSTTVAVLLSFASGFLISAQLSAHSIQQNLSGRMSISFPSAFKTQEMGPSTLYNLRLADSTANFVAIVTDLQKGSGIDAATLAKVSMQSEFWEQAAEGFMGQMGKGATLKSREMKTLKGYDIMQLTIERPNPDGSIPNSVTVYIFVDDVYSLNIAHTNRSGKADDKIKQAFFDSLTIKD